MEVAPGVHHFDTDPFNWYLIEEGGRLTLVDAGFPGHYRVFQEGLKSLGRSVQDVEAIVITHAHADHTGFAERVRRETGAPVYVHAADRTALGRVLHLPWAALLGNAWRPFGFSILGRATLAGIFSMPHVTQARTFQDGEVLDVPGRPQILHLPGHTAGESVLFLPERGVLLSGDALLTRDLITGEYGPPQVCRSVLNDDDKAARRSIDRLGELGQVTILPGHGRPWSGHIGQALELAHQHR